MNATMAKTIEGEVVTAEVVSPAAITPSYVVPLAERKVGHRCCGCCCDSRRAVIIVEVIFGLVFNIIAILLVVSAGNTATSLGLDDDSFVSDVKRATAVTSTIYGLGMIVSLCVIYGAVTYRRSFVALGILWTMTQTAIGIFIQAKTYTKYGLAYPVYDAAMRIGISGLLIYPLAVFVHEVNKGVMCKETYPREEHSCCCV